MSGPGDSSQRDQIKKQHETDQKKDQIKQSLDARKGRGEKKSVEKRRKESVKGGSLGTDERESLQDRTTGEPLDMTLKTLKNLEKKALKESSDERKPSSDSSHSKADVKEPADRGQELMSDDSLEDWVKSVKDEINKLIEWARQYRPDEQIGTKETKRGLSASEKKERRRVAKPVDGLGFAFGKDKPAKGEWDRWFSGLSDKEKAALKHPHCIVSIKTYRSRAGKESFNVDLSERSANNVEGGLVARGVPRSSIKKYWFGENIAKFKRVRNGQDRAIDRVARIEIDIREPGGEATNSKSKKKAGAGQIPGAMRDIGKEIGEVGAAPQKPDRQSISKGLRDLIDDVHIDTLIQLSENLLFEVAGLAKTAIGYITKLGEANYELHRANVQSLRRWGLNYGTLILQRDTKQPDNVHIESGKPYTGKELYQEIMKQPSLVKQMIDDERTLGRANVAEANKVLRDSIDKVADHANTLLKRGKTPEERKAIMQVFVGLVQNRLKKSYGKSLRPARR